MRTFWSNLISDGVLRRFDPPFEIPVSNSGRPLNINSHKTQFFRRTFHPTFSFVWSSLAALVLIAPASTLVGQESNRANEIQLTIDRLQRELETLQSDRPDAASTVPSLFDARGLEVAPDQLNPTSEPGSVVILDSPPADAGSLQLSAPLAFDSVAPGFVPVPGTVIQPSFSDPTVSDPTFGNPTTAVAPSSNGLPNMSPAMRPSARNPYQSSRGYYRPPYSSHGSEYYGSTQSGNYERESGYDDYRQPYYNRSYYGPPSCGAFCPIR